AHFDICNGVDVTAAPGLLNITHVPDELLCAFFRIALFTVKAQEKIRCILEQQTLLARIKPRDLGAALLVNLLRPEIRPADDVCLRSAADEFFTCCPLLLEADIHVAACFVDYHATFQRAIAPLLFCHGNGAYLSNLKSGSDMGTRSWLDLSFPCAIS